jgi:hypothetical protein
MIWLSLNLLLRMLLTPLMDSTITWRNFRGAGQGKSDNELLARMHVDRGQVGEPIKRKHAPHILKEKRNCNVRRPRATLSRVEVANNSSLSNQIE